MALPTLMTIINVPSDIGSMIKGKHSAPQAFRDAGLLTKLRDAGYQITMSEALPDGPRVWRLSSNATGVRREEENVEVCHLVRDAVKAGLGGTSPPFQLILGGECCILPAIMSAFWYKHYPARVGLIYVDGDCDLTIPNEEGSSGNFASMTLTHLTRRPGSLISMDAFDRPDGRPVVDSSNFVLFGLNMALQGNRRDQLGHLFDENFRVISSAAVANDPQIKAWQALKWLEERADHIIVHFDFDSVDGGEFPLANVPNFTGVGLSKMMQAIRIFLGSSKVCGLVVAEANPDHDPGLEMTSALSGHLVEAFLARREKLVKGVA